MKKEVLLLLL